MKEEDWRLESLPKASDSFDPMSSIFKFALLSSRTVLGNIVTVQVYKCKVCDHYSAEKRLYFTVEEMKQHCLDSSHSSRVKQLIEVEQKNLLESRRRFSQTSSLAFWLGSMKFSHIFSSGSILSGLFRVLLS
jgi:RNA-binding protein YlmH